MTITFYTLIYKVKSKFDFDKYKEWGNNLMKNIKNNNFIIFTNLETYDIIKDIIDFTNNNIKIKILEFNEFKYYKYKLYFEKCKKLIDGYNIDWKLLLIWIERILLLNKIKDTKTEYYAHVDFGYFRDDKFSDAFLNNIDILNNLNKDKIYYCLVYNDLFYIKNILNQNLYKEIIGGGFFIIHYDKIDYYINLFNDKVLYYINNKELIKDDQYILQNIIFDKNNINNFELITDKNSCLNYIYLEKVTREYNYYDYIKSIYYSKLIFENYGYDNIENYFRIKNNDYSIIDYNGSMKKSCDNWFVFRKFLSCIDKNKFIVNNCKKLFYNYYLICNELGCNVICENKNIKVFNLNDNIYILLKIKTSSITYKILYNMIDTFIPITKLNINSNLNINSTEYQFIIEISRLFNFEIQFV